VVIETVTEKLALRMLAETGDAVIQNAHTAAAAERAGKLDIAASLTEIAERLWNAEAGVRNAA